MSAVFDLSFIINYRIFFWLAWQIKTKKMKATGTISKNCEYERTMLKIEGDIPF